MDPETTPQGEDKKDAPEHINIKVLSLYAALG
jgi:hypothetical protein